MSLNRKKYFRFRPAKELPAQSGFDWGLRSALRRAGFAADGAAKWLSEQTSAIFGRLLGQSSELVCSRGDQAAIHEMTASLPDIVAGPPFPGVEFFALVDLFDSSQVHYHGVELGTGAFTVGPASGTSKTSFGHWDSMEGAFKRLDQLAGPDAHLALVVYDTVPVLALSALGVHTPRVLVAPEIRAVDAGLMTEPSSAEPG